MLNVQKYETKNKRQKNNTMQWVNIMRNRNARKPFGIWKINRNGLPLCEFNELKEFDKFTWPMCVFFHRCWFCCWYVPYCAIMHASICMNTPPFQYYFRYLCWFELLFKLIMMICCAKILFILFEIESIQRNEMKMKF